MVFPVSPWWHGWDWGGGIGGTIFERGGGGKTALHFKIMNPVLSMGDAGSIRLLNLLSVNGADFFL